jgi:Poly(R)-hydroxyalkanoic acid synthase subunit (PHA_synth_III_E)
MLELNRGEPGAYASMRKTWSEWSDKMTEQLSKASGSDRSSVKDIQDAWARNATKINKLLTEQATRQASAQMDRFAKASETQAKALKSTSSKDVSDMSDLTTTMAKYWADNYSNVVGSIQGIIEGEGDASGKSKRIYDAWSGFTSDMMKQVMRTAAFSKWMGSMRDADLDAMAQARQLTEETLRAMGSPTKSDMDEVQRSLKELTMELRSLKQSLKVKGANSPKAKGADKPKRKAKKN